MQSSNPRNTKFEERHLAFLEQCLDGYTQSLNPFDPADSKAAKLFKEYQSLLYLRCILKDTIQKCRARPEKKEELKLWPIEHASGE